MSVPVRINMGGTAQVDSHDNLWLGDGPGGIDPLNIRPDDLGGQFGEDPWFIVNFKPDSLDALGFDGLHPGDISIFNSIRWDNGAAPPDFYVEIPIPNGEYLVNLFFNEGCCATRHFKIEIQGEVLDDDVSYLDYDIAGPELGRVGRLSFEEIVVDNEILRIGFLPCPECPGAMDTNAIIDAIEILSGTGCDHDGLNFNCTYDEASDRVVGTWNPIINAEGYRVLKNGVAFGADLPAGATSFSDPTPRSGGVNVSYVLQAIDGGAPFSQCRCSLQAVSCPRDLSCTTPPGTNRVNLAWRGPLGLTVTGYEVRRNGALIASLPGTATAYDDLDAGSRLVDYAVTVLTNPPSLCPDLTCCADGIAFETLPLRINMGGPELVDSQGRVWLGDGDAIGDPLCIRPDDASGTNVVPNWCTNPVPDAQSVSDLGFDPTNPSDIALFNSIRWDTGGDGRDFRLNLAVPNDEYTVNLYFIECCCSFRHFKIEIEGEIVDDDVSSADYNPVPANGKVGRLTFADISVSDGMLNIGLLPCPEPECAGSLDANAIISAVEVLPENPCPVDPTFRQCPDNLVCTVGAGGAVSGTWNRALFCDGQLTGYELRKDGAFLQNLPAGASSFSDTLTTRAAYYELVPIVAAGDPCRTMACTAVRDDVPFAAPVRINMGGNTRRDSRGRLWIGDGAGPGDSLSLRPNDLGGANTVESWCVGASQAQADSLGSLGLDAFSADDQAIFNTIRWDNSVADAEEFRMEVPMVNGTYLVNLYFTECCCTFRHFMLELQGDLVELDVSAASYSTSGELGRTGRLSYRDVSVTDGVLRLALLACLEPDCPGSTNGDAIIDAIEVLANNTLNQTCPKDLVCELAQDGSVTGSWTPPENVTVTGYNLYRNGELVTSLPAGATEFVDAPSCVRFLKYEVEVLSGAADFLCPGLRLVCRVLQPDCNFELPLRINMGGQEVADSHGNLWLGDGPGGIDPLLIRPDDLGGEFGEENWVIQNFQPDSLDALGFDGTHPGDISIFNSIRWDNGVVAPDFYVELPLANGGYQVNLYFGENCCINRHFKIEIQGEIVNDDVSYLDYDVANPGLGRVGVLSFDGIAVDDQILRIGFLPCPECPGVTDTNAIIDAIEVLASGSFEICNNSIDDDGDLLSDCDDPDCDAFPSCQPVVGQFHRGDSNNDGKHNISDPVNTLNVLFLGSGSITCQEAADSNDDGKVNISDPVNSLNVLFLGLGNVPPPLPPEALVPCGSDPTPNVPPLGCDSYTNC